MKYIDEFRSPEEIEKILSKIRKYDSQEWKIMEICGGQTHTILKYGIEELLPPNIQLIHGPGCPVCVTPGEKIDLAVELALNKDFILVSFGDMLRVPGSKSDLLTARAEGGNVMIAYSPLDCLNIAQNYPDKNVVFFAVGFETTAPAIASTILTAKKRGIKNFYVLSSHVLVPPAIELLLSREDNLISGFLAAGHVCTVMGYKEYEAIADKYSVPVAVTGFEPLDILNGILSLARQLDAGTGLVENMYPRAVKREGNLNAQREINTVFCKADRAWRGIGMIPGSGLAIRDEFAEFDIEARYEFRKNKDTAPKSCIAGEILTGRKKPLECPSFRTSCSPEMPLGAPMVSSEGACAAYYKYHT